jgi:phosphoribosylformylglycinamidine synthase subunit PurL
MTNAFTDAQIKAEGLTLEEYAMVCDRLNREPNRAELGMFGVMWSEHCCYKNSR